MEFKYIMLIDRKLDRRVPIMFFEPVTHIGMYEMTRHNNELARFDLVSAGFGRVSRGKLGKLFIFIEVFGESTSLKDKGLPHTPLEDDGDVISLYNYLHGLG